MTVLLTWSENSGDIGYSEFDGGASASGSETTSKTVYLRHDSDNTVTSCMLYCVPKTGTYEGDTTSVDDFAELLSWGNSSGASDFGGIQINFDAVGGFSGGTSWGMSESQKTSTDGLKYTIRTGVGDSLANAILLPVEMSSNLITPGEIPTLVEDARMQIRIKVPANEGDTGARQFSIVLSYEPPV